MAYRPPTREFSKMWPSEWEVDGEGGLTMLKPVGLCEHPISRTPTLYDLDPEKPCAGPAVGQIVTEYRDPSTGEWQSDRWYVCEEHAEQVKRQASERVGTLIEGGDDGRE